MITARVAVIAEQAEARGWSMMRLADELGVALNTAQALLAGRPVASATISAALRVFAPLGFDDLFEAGQPAAAQTEEVAA